MIHYLLLRIYYLVFIWKQSWNSQSIAKVEIRVSIDPLPGFP